MLTLPEDVGLPDSRQLVPVMVGVDRRHPNLSVLNLTDRPDGGGQQGTGLAGVLQAIGETNALELSPKFLPALK